MGVVLFAAVVMVLAFALTAVVWVFKSRCPACGKPFAARVVSSSEVANVTTSEFRYDDQRGEYRDVSTNHTGYLVARTCRFCGHDWERMESSSRQVDRLTDAEAEEYRRHHH
jgi:hypothetical protein